MKNYTDADMETMLMECLEDAIDNDENYQYEQFQDLNVRVKTFADCCALTRNKGLVIKVGSSEFQISIVQVK